MKVLGLDDSRGRSWREQVCCSNDCAQNAGYGREEAEDVLDAIEAVIHGGQLGTKHQQRIQCASRAVCRGADAIGIDVVVEGAGSKGQVEW